MAEMSMREAYGRALADYGGVNADVVVLDVDTSSSTLTNFFYQRFPERFVNIGIAEPCMIDVAVGLALGGKRPLPTALPLCWLCGPSNRSDLRLLCPHQRQNRGQLRRGIRLQRWPHSPFYRGYCYDARAAGDDGYCPGRLCGRWQAGCRSLLNTTGRSICVSTARPPWLYMTTACRWKSVKASPCAMAAT